MSLSDASSKQTFYDQLTVLPTSEAIFLLTTFANMAGCRSDEEMDFIEVVTGEIFEVVLSPPCSCTLSIFCIYSTKSLFGTFRIR